MFNNVFFYQSIFVTLSIVFNFIMFRINLFISLNKCIYKKTSLTDLQQHQALILVLLLLVVFKLFFFLSTIRTCFKHKKATLISDTRLCAGVYFCVCRDSLFNPQKLIICAINGLFVEVN